MSKAAYRIYFNNAPATPEQMALLGEIRIDQGIGVAAEAQLDMTIGTDTAGLWPGIEADHAQAFTRVRIEVQVADAGFAPLIEGLVVGNRYMMKANPNESLMTLIVQDDSVQLSRDDKVVLFEQMAPQDIAGALFAEAGLTAEIDAPADAAPRVLVQRGTNMQMLRELARRHGMFAYVRPGLTPGASIGMFKLAVFDAPGLPDIVLLGEKRNVASFSAEFDALRPIKAQAFGLGVADKRVLASSAGTAATAPLGGLPVHSLLQPAATLLAGAAGEQGELDALVAAAVDRSSWAYCAEGELDTDTYAGVLQPYQLVTVRGVGGYLSGDYLIGHVNHIINDNGYRQRFSLHRNARSAGDGPGAAVATGVF
jgi:hypothetical protein